MQGLILLSVLIVLFCLSRYLKVDESKKSGKILRWSLFSIGLLMLAAMVRGVYLALTVFS